MRETYQPPTTSLTGPPHDHTHPCHSRTRPRHSREGGNPPRCAQTHEETAILPPSTKSDENSCARSSIPAHLLPSFPHPPTSFPRRRESTPLRPNPRRDGHPPALYKIRRKSTESDKILTETRARAGIEERAREASPGLLGLGLRFVSPFPCARGIPSRHSREGGNPRARPRSVSFLSA